MGKLNACHRLIEIIKSFIKQGRFDPIPPQAKIGKNVYIGSPCTIDSLFDGKLVTIGDYSVISKGVTILTHDASSNRKTGLIFVSPVSIGKYVFIGNNSIILPGVTIGDGAVIGAGSVVSRDVKEGDVVVGNPIRVLCTASDLHQRRYLESTDSAVIDVNIEERRYPSPKTISIIERALNDNKSLFINTNEQRTMKDE